MSSGAPPDPARSDPPERPRESGPRPEGASGGRPRLFLVDGSALAYRSHFAFARSPLTTSRGEPSSAVFGFASTLWSLLRDHRPEYMAVVFDTPEPTFRHREFEAYKAHRAEMPAELVEQLPRIQQLVDAFPLASCAVPGVEADDLMGSMAVQLAGPDLEAVLVSGDKDFCQLVGDDIRILNLGRGGPARVEAHWLDAAGVEARFGVPPSRVIEVLALMGDASDGVPGVPGIGEKTASALIAEFGDLETLLASLARVARKSVQEKLIAHTDLARLSRRLVTILTDLPLPLGLEQMRVRPAGAGLVRFFREMEFGRLARVVETTIGAGGGAAAGSPRAAVSPATPPAGAGEAAPGPGADAGPAAASAPAPPAPPETGVTLSLFGAPEARQKLPPWIEEAPPTDADYRVARSDEDLRALAADLSAAGGFSIDTETTGVDPTRAGLVGLSFSPAPGRGFYVPLAHREGPNAAGDAVQAILGPLLADPALPKSGQNIKYDLHLLHRHGLPVNGVAFDTMIASYLLDPERSHKLDNLAHEHLGYTMVPLQDVIGRGAGARSFAEVPVPLACRYSAEDADITLRLAKLLGPQLEERGMDRLFREVEMPLLLVLRRMEAAGVAVDVPFLAAMSERLGVEMKRLEGEAHAAAGEAFNLNSPVQLGRILFDTLKLPRARRTKTGFSTDNEVLEKLAPLHQLPRRVLDYRQLAKLKSTYVDALPRLIHPETGRIHTSFNQTVAATGRLSSSDPNLQNIPIRTPLGREVRRAFIAGDESLVLISADYSQIELRIMAHISGDRRLIDGFRRGIDVHSETAASIFGVAPDAVTKEQRARAKTVNFGIMYGQGAVGLAQQIGVTRQEAAAFINAYRAQYPGVAGYLERTIAEARRTGYVTTLLKRRRYLPNLASPHQGLRAEAERMAVNTPIQGTAADLIKVAMIAADADLARRHPRARLLLQVHDELVLEAPREEAVAVAAAVKERMEGALELDVPVVVEVGAGRDWADIH